MFNDCFTTQMAFYPNFWGAFIVLFLCNNGFKMITFVNILHRSGTSFSKCLSGGKSLKRLFCTTCVRNAAKEPAGFRGKRSHSADIPPMGYVLLVVPISTFCLGTWQIQRLGWKLRLIENLEEKTLSPPVPFPDDLRELDDLEYRRVRVRGTFDHSRELYIGPRSLKEERKGSGGGGGGTIITGQSNVGSLVITPFKLADRDLTILVNRGFVPKKLKNPERRKEGQVEGEVELTGVVRKTEHRPAFGVKNDPSTNQWFYRDIDTMAQLLNTAPVFLDADENSTVPGGPIGGQTQLSVRNEHLSYILTWYTLCIFTSYMWYAQFLKRVR